MRIAIISQYYPPESTLIPHTLAQGLQQRGHTVRVLTGFPNYPEGKLFDGYHQAWRTRENDGDVQVLRVPLWVDHSLNPGKRMLNYASFGLSVSSAWSFVRGADVIYVYATQMTPAFAPWVWRLIGGAPYVLHVQDLWPDSITGSSLVSPGRAARLVERMLTPWLRSVYKRSAAVIGIAPTMVETLIERGSDPSKVHLQYNWAPEGSKPQEERTAAEATGEGVSLLYAGNMGDMQDLDTVVEAAHRSADAGIRLSLVGDGVALPRLKQLVNGLGATNVTFEGRIPRTEMRRIYARSDFSLVTLKDLPNFRGTVPSKFQASLSQGLPIITTVQGDVRSIVEELQVGFTADAENVESLERAFRRAAESSGEARQLMAKRASDSYRQRFSQRAGVDSLEQILMSVAVRAKDKPDLVEQERH